MEDILEAGSSSSFAQSIGPLGPVFEIIWMLYESLEGPSPTS